MNRKITSIFLGLLFLVMARPEVSLGQVPDTANLKYKATRIDGKKFLIEFVPPAEHHFNLKGPNAVNVDSETAILDKTETKISATLKSKKNECHKISANLFVCDNKNTYCMPIKQEFMCNEIPSAAPQSGREKAAQYISQKKAQGEADGLAKQNELDSFWLKDLDAGLAAGKMLGKHVLVDFYGIWCPPCNVLDETVFNSKEFVALQKKLVVVKLDADNPASFQWKSKYDVHGYPTVILMSNDGVELTRMVGSKTKKAFIAEINSTLKNSSKQTDWDLAKKEMVKEDFMQAFSHALNGLRKTNMDNDQRITFATSMFSIFSNLATEEGSQRILAGLLDNWLTSELATEEPAVETIDVADSLYKIADKLKIDVLKNRALNAKFRTTEFYLAHPKKLNSEDWNRAGLLSTEAEVYENLHDETKMKEFYLKAAAAYEEDIKATGLSIEAERGNNLDRIYCLYKAGLVDEAMHAYEGLEKRYPEEFTFYYAHADALSELGQKEKALPVAQKALQYSYGDNKLRAAYLVADLQVKSDQKKEAGKLIDKVLADFPDVKNLHVRSSRYIEKLNKLKKQLE